MYDIIMSTFNDFFDQRDPSTAIQMEEVYGLQEDSILVSL